MGCDILPQAVIVVDLQSNDTMHPTASSYQEVNTGIQRGQDWIVEWLVLCTNGSKGLCSMGSGYGFRHEQSELGDKMWSLHSIGCALEINNTMLALLCCKKYCLQYTFFVEFVSLISSNIATKCLLCLCMTSYILDMHIGSLWGLKFFIWSFDLQRSRSLGLVTQQIEATVALNIMVKNIFIFMTTLSWGQALKWKKLPLYSLLYIGYACT